MKEGDILIVVTSLDSEGFEDELVSGCVVVGRGLPGTVEVDGCSDDVDNITLIPVVVENDDVDTTKLPTPDGLWPGLEDVDMRLPPFSPTNPSYVDCSAGIEDVEELVYLFSKLAGEAVENP